MNFKPLPDNSRWEGVAVCAWIVMIDALLLLWTARRPSDMIKFLLVILMVASLPLLFHYLYRTWSAFTLEYWVDRNALTVHWANRRQVIPMGTVKRVVQNLRLEDEPPGVLEWPAPYLRPVAANSAATIHQLASRPLTDCLLIDTDHGRYALSPADVPSFVALVQERYRMGPSALLKPERLQLGWLAQALGDDRWGMALLVTGLLGVLLLFGVLMISFPGLPDALTVRYNSQGTPEEIREKAALFRLPLIGLLAWLVNGGLGLWMLSSKHRTGAYLLWGGAIVVQVFMLIALVNLIT
jgi:hypothetical protein